MFFGGIFLEDLFEGFSGGFFGSNSLLTLLKSAKLLEPERDWCIFVWFCLKEGQEEGQEI